MFFTFHWWVVSGNSKFDSYWSKKTNSVGLSFTLKDDEDKKPRLTFMIPILSGKNRKEKESKPAFDLYSNEKYTGEIGFFFHFREWISWWQIVLYHLVALISSSERQGLFYITKTRRNFYTSSPQNAMTISISVPMFKQYPQGHLRNVSLVLIYTWKAITYQRSPALNSEENLFLSYVPFVNERANSVPQSKPAGGGFFCRCNWVQRVYTPMKNSTTYTTILIRPHGSWENNTTHHWLQRGTTHH